MPDGAGALRTVVEALGATYNLPEPCLGTWDQDTEICELDTGQRVYRPLLLVAPPDDGQRVLAIYYQGGHNVAIIPCYSVIGST
jgi:hypothetical protein